MIGALWTGISGLSSHQAALDNESHNISNVNTIGYKSSRISFADQMYQDRIGKGSKVLDAEKLYTQGNLKLTGVDYDMALSGEGFFTVLNTSSGGTGETLYTRAGNFRMGDNGTLQDAAGNEVQGWAMTPIDPSKDVVSTNPNTTTFTNDYNKLLSSKVVQHSTYIETITAKATDYTQTAKADSETVFDGAGMKSQSAKISDVEELVKNYQSWLQKLADNPDQGSASSTSQISQINFKTEDEGLASKEGDQIYVYINGNKVSQNFVSVTADFDLKKALYDQDQARNPGDQVGYPDPGTKANPANLTEAENAMFDKEASRIETYKELANSISEIPGLKAYMVSEKNTSTGINDVLEDSDTFSLSTDPMDMLKGIIQIESIIPGEEFTISEVGEVSGTTTVAGAHQTSTPAVKGSGVGALESARDALAKAITGKQQDVYTPSDIGLSPYSDHNDFTYSLQIFDKELGKTIPVPNDNGIPPQAVDMAIDNVTSIDDFVQKFNAQAASTTPPLSSYVEAINLNGNVVIQTKDDNYDVDFSANLRSQSPGPIDTYTSIVAQATIADNTSTVGIGGLDFTTSEDFTFTFDDANGVGQTVTITDPSDIDDLINKMNAQSGATGLTASKDSNGDLVIKTANHPFSGTPVLDDGLTGNTSNATISSESVPTGEATIAGSSIHNAPDGANDYLLTYTDLNGIDQTIIINDPADLNAVATQINTASGGALSASVNGSGDLEIVTNNAPFAGNPTLQFVPDGSENLPIDKNNDYSGREGAGAEFIEIVTTVEQTTSQSSLQLRLDTLGISDSAFGEFSVDSSGVIYMKQDGAEFAIGQVAIAQFNNNQGLNPVGDNLLEKTNTSGEPIYNLNNDKAAKVEGQTLELSTADLSESLVNLMVFQRAFEANAKSITTSDELLNTLINLKR